MRNKHQKKVLKITLDFLTFHVQSYNHPILNFFYVFHVI
jgi:hypothetical protein